MSYEVVTTVAKHTQYVNGGVGGGSGGGDDQRARQMCSDGETTANSDAAIGAMVVV